MVSSTERNGQLPTPQHLREPLAVLGGRLDGHFGPRLRQLRLFGSAARYAAHEDSDVDVAVVVQDLTGPERELVLDLATDISATFDIPLSVFVVSFAHFDTLLRRGRTIALDIVREGIVVW